MEAIIPLAAHNSPAKATRPTSGAVAPGCETDLLTADSNPWPGNRWNSQSTTFLRTSDGKSKSTTETTRAASGTNENSTR
jgi:hypothetical protein